MVAIPHVTLVLPQTEALQNVTCQLCLKNHCFDPTLIADSKYSLR